MAPLHSSHSKISVKCPSDARDQREHIRTVADELRPILICLQNSSESKDLNNHSTFFTAVKWGCVIDLFDLFRAWRSLRLFLNFKIKSIFWRKKSWSSWHFKSCSSGTQMASSSTTTSTSAETSSAAATSAVNTSSVEPELQDLESSLLALEKLDRASPDLWPDQSE